MNTTLSTGETLSFPVVTRDVTQFVAIYSVRASDVNRLLPRDLSAIDTGYGLTHMYLYWLQAGDSDFGPFSEFAVNFTVCEPHYNSQGLHYFANPVSTERARRVGFEVWGNPTSLAKVEVSHTGKSAHCVLTENGEFVLSLSALSVPSAPCTTEGILTAAADFSVRGRSSVYRFRQTANACIREDKPAHVTLKLGTHPLGARLRTLLCDDIPIHSVYYTGSTIKSGPRFTEHSSRKH